LAERLQSFPAVTNEVVVRDGEALWGLLMAGEIEFFASADPPLHDLSRVRVEVLGNSPLCLLVRRDHPLLSDPLGAGRFPLVRASWGGLKVPAEVQHWVLTEANVIEDFGVLEKLTTRTDCMWLASAHAVPEMVRSGDLVELFRSERSVELVICSLKRRSLSSLASVIIDDLRSQISHMTGGARLS
jgi:DNA-binding transcriptional LysR family regulator